MYSEIIHNYLLDKYAMPYNGPAIKLENAAEQMEAGIEKSDLLDLPLRP